VSSALIGHTGFVGGHLAREESFDVFVNRSNVESLAGREFERIVCAGLPAAKWLANRSPAEDLDNVRRLENVLRSVQVQRFILISTIDVYPHLAGGDERFDCASKSNHAYGAHRLRFERFVRDRFATAHVVRLPALFGAGLKKNVLFDLLHDNQLERIDPGTRFQWYPLARLSADLKVVEERDLPLVNLFPEPIETAAILRDLFPHKTVGERTDASIVYDLHTQYGPLFGGDQRYTMSGAAALAAMRDFVRRETAVQ
jgi:hypothetical protein